MTTQARLTLLEARGRAASDAQPKLRLVKPEPSTRKAPPLRIDDMAFPRCPSNPADHQAYRVRRGNEHGMLVTSEIHCSWCNEIYASDGRGGWKRSGERALDRKLEAMP